MREETVLLLAHHLKEMRLEEILRQYPSVACRDSRLTRRIRDARFPLVRTLEQFHCDSAPDLDKRVILVLTEGQCIREHRHVIFVGKTGAGRMHLALSRGIEDCRQGIRSRFVTAGSELIRELGCVSFSKESSPLLLQVLADRYERDSVIITNLDFADWTQSCGNPALTVIPLEGLTRKVSIINGSWESHRLKESLNRKSMFIEREKIPVSPWRDDRYNFNSPRGRTFSVAIIKLTNIVLDKEEKL